MKVKAKVGIIFNGEIYRAGEVFDVDDTTNYSFSWLTKKGWVEIVDESTPDDGLLAGGGDSADIPPLDEPAPLKKGKKNA